MLMAWAMMGGAVSLERSTACKHDPMRLRLSSWPSVANWDVLKTAMLARVCRTQSGWFIFGRWQECLVDALQEVVV